MQFFKVYIMHFSHFWIYFINKKKKEKTVNIYTVAPLD